MQVGKLPVHASHNMMVYNGLVFCKSCGSWAAKKFQNLAKACDPVGRNADDTERIRQRALSSLQGKLPRGLKSWPNSKQRLLNLEE